MIEQVEKLEDILEPYHGQIVWCSDEDKAYRFDAVEGWQEVPEDSTSTQLNMNVYEMNKQIIGQLEILDKATMEEKGKIVRDFVSSWGHKYYMLLCRELNYYTLFNINLKDADETVEDVLFECAEVIGDIKSVEAVDDNCAIEIWVTSSDNDTYVMYFFPYDNGVVVCG